MCPVYRVPFIFVAGILQISCTDNTLDSIRESGELIVITRNSPTTVYEGRDGKEGPEHSLISRFANDHDLTVRYIIKDSVDDIITSIQSDEGHIAAAGLTHTAGRKSKGFIFGPEYHDVHEQLVCRRNHKPVPKTPEDLAGLKLHVIENSSYDESLMKLKQDYPDMSWTVDDKNDTEELLKQVWLRKIDCTVADSTIVSINRRYYPELVVAFDISEERPMSWVIAPKWKSLNSYLEDWFYEIKKNGFLENVKEKYYGHVEIFDYVDMRLFIKRSRSRLPKYIDNFKAAAKKYNLSWSLLAAQAYQESHWKANAKSPTGVRGIMMLTLNTAKSVDVKNRLDPVSSIMGGARYLRRMINRIPENVKGENRLWYALAAYNIGYGHLQDAQTLAKRMGKNPDKWVDLKDVLPYLSKKQYYSTLKYGYARGTEPVRYVQRIRNYRQVLEEKM